MPWRTFLDAAMLWAAPATSGAPPQGRSESQEYGKQLMEIRHIRRGPTRFTLYLGLCLAAASVDPALADKTDVLVLKNGDRITGEVKKLERGKLRYSTDSMGTIYVEWKDVQGLVSKEYYRLRLSDGRRFYGTLSDAGGLGTLTVAGERGTDALPLIDFVGITPIDDTWRDRTDSTVGAGYSYAKSSRITRAHLYANFEYTGEKRVLSGDLRTELSDDGDETSTSARATGVYEKLRPNRVYRFGVVQAEQNDELDLDLRLLLGAGIGRSFVETNRRRLRAAGGLAVAQEESGDGTSNTELEGVLFATYDSFLFDTPKLDLTSSLAVYPGLTEAGRVRANYDVTLRREFVEDFFWDLGLAGTYDTDPNSDDAAKSDYSITTGLSYEF
jgi:putative salt-induced outer membrane protein YdiY